MMTVAAVLGLFGKLRHRLAGSEDRHPEGVHLVRRVVSDRPDPVRAARE